MIVDTMLAASDISSCCTLAYGHPLARWLLGESFHPGGLELTARLAGLLGIGPDAAVLDAGSGRGASAIHLAKTIGCRVTGFTLEDEGVAAARELAKASGVEDKTVFIRADIREVDLEVGSFDFVLLECVLSILGSKDQGARRLFDLLRPGGRIGVSDVTSGGPLPQDMQGLLATAGCVGGALSLAEYSSILEAEGFEIERSEDCPEAASSFLARAGGMLKAAEVAAKLGVLSIGDGLLEEAGRLLSVAENLVRRGVLGYGLVVARRPE